MPTVSFEASDESYRVLRASKTRYAESLGKDIDQVSWLEWALAYANSKRLP